jgi:hypothetical protein
MRVVTKLQPRCCYECPFEYDTIECTHPAAPGDGYLGDVRTWTGVPAWCPLLRGAATVRLAADAPVARETP